MPRTGRPRLDPKMRIANNTERTEDCWLWVGELQKNGYGRLRAGAKWQLAHRFSYTVYTGQDISGLTIDHVCRVRNCVNPAHLRACSQKENSLAAHSLSIAKQRKEQTHCVNGHEFTQENTYTRRNGCRACRRCIADCALRRYHAMKGE